ncbi:MAG: aromatic amino acid hydroxylase [Bdellovibrionales bacterium]
MKIPVHLKKFTLTQNYSRYTPMDQAGWRYIMRISEDFFKDHAHNIYLQGLPSTGISTEYIPKISEMNLRLEKLGWNAAVISGFIPPAIFLEFLSLGILPIACDMRTPEHLSYTPAPDIVHEAAGHAPILANADYADYIRQYGEVSQKVIFSEEDLAVYNAIRKLSDVKEDPKSTPKEIEEANQELIRANEKNTNVSEATLLSRMAWWTIEYGLVGSMERPLIYGAGLLSSVGESYDCYANNVEKRPLTLDCIYQTYDITKPQPQLFVTPSFAHLKKVLKEFSELLAYKIGGLKALEKAQQARTLTTTVWNTGVQFSGKLTEISAEHGKPIYLKWQGPAQLSFANKEIKNFGPKNLKKNWECPVGKMKAPLVSKNQLKGLGFTPRSRGTIEWPESGYAVTGKLKRVATHGNRVLALLLTQAIVSRNGKPLSKHKEYLIPVGIEIVSVFGEAADRAAYYKVVKTLHEPKVKQKSNLTKENKKLNKFYLEVRKLREVWNKNSKKKVSKLRIPKMKEKLVAIAKQLNQFYPEDWLLRLEILELALLDPQQRDLVDSLETQLRLLQNKSSDQKKLIARGMNLIKSQTTSSRSGELQHRAL